MANTINSTTDEALLRSIIDGSITEFEDDMVTSIQSHKFAYCSDLTKVNIPNATLINDNAFKNCTSLIKVDIPNVSSINNHAFWSCTALTKVSAPLLNGSTNYNSNIFEYCSGLKRIALPSWTKVIYSVIFQYCTLLEAADLATTGITGTSLFKYCPNFTTLVLRSSSLVSLAALNNFDYTPMRGASGTYSGHIYVPQSLISEYQNATNWSSMYASYNGLFQPIEGSIYENYYADGTPIGLSSYGLIGYYAVGENGRYEAIENVPSHINSSVDSDLVAYTSTDSNPVHRSQDTSTSLIPDEYYQGYGKRSCLCIYSSNSFFSDNDVLTVEYSCAKNASDAYISGNVWGSYKDTMTASTGVTIANGSTFTVSGLSDKMFLHKLIEYHKDGTIKTYINGVLRQTRTADTSNLTNMNWLSLGHSGQSTAYLGPVAIYDRALTSDEIAEHYQFYVDNYMVGQTAYDSSGNFVGD